MFKKILITILVTLVILIAVSFSFLKNEVPTSQYPIIKPEQKTIYINSYRIIVEIADEPHEQTRGLSGKENLSENSGMLFVFKSPTVPAFWMKDMNFSLDMIWIDANKTIIAITKNVSPDTFPKTFFPPSPILYVLEVHAGWSDRNNIKLGNKLEL